MKISVITPVLITFFMMGSFAWPQSLSHYKLNVNVPDKPVRSGHLDLGGANPSGEVIEVNSYYLTINGKPLIPVTGEFHYSRYPAQYWDESIKKMKAGGITVIATYVFWNIHEEKEGRFKWQENLDLRRFVNLCGENGLSVIVRIGPFCHGEIRNGGLPDWLLGRPVNIRSNDPAYLVYVDRLYKEIGKQLKGLYFKDGGPVIGIQIENEYQHSAAPWGLTYPGQPHDWTVLERDLAATHQGVSVAQGDNPFASLGNDHMMVLKTLAIQAGMEVPLFTATGWGYAAIAENESIPVTAAYAYPFWTEGKDLSPFFLYKDMHANPDYSPVRYVSEDYPVLAAELGSGISSVYTRRPVADQKSMDALINRCLGSGANGIGFYMYHGGSTPRGDDCYFADEAYGCPKINYDYQAPIGEYGQIREGYNRLKLIHFFLQDYGDILAPMTTVLPANSSAITPDNLAELRYAARVKGGSGFLFINNFQDDAVMTEKSGISINLKTGQGEINIPESGGFNLMPGENVVFPFNLEIGGGLLKYATAQLLLKGGSPERPFQVFFAPEGLVPEFRFDRSGIQKLSANSGCKVEKRPNGWLVKCRAGEPSEFTLKTAAGVTDILVISKEMAMKSWPVVINRKRCLIITGAAVLQDGQALRFTGTGKSSFEMGIYPKTPGKPVISSGTLAEAAGPDLFSTWKVNLPSVLFETDSHLIGQRKIVVKLPATMPAGISDIFLTIDYTGDTGMAFLEGELVADHFYNGIPWEIGLKRFYPDAAGKEIVLYFRSLNKDATFLGDLLPESVPDFQKEGTLLEIKNITLTPEYHFTIKF